MSREEFKSFVRKNPKLLKHVRNNEMSWQKFYEMYDLYGEDETVWQPYLKEEAAAVAATAGVSEWLKNINLDSVQDGINNIQRVLGLFQDMGKKETPKEEYKPRPMYKHFED